jgi:pectate lyase
LGGEAALYRLAATNARGTATSNAVTLTVLPDPALAAAQALKAQLAAPGAATVTITGTVDLSLVGGATVASGKTIAGADAAATITGTLTLATGADNAVIQGINFTAGALAINGAHDMHVSHCTFTDAPVTITGGADNIAFAWNKFTATPAAAGSAMTISNAGAATGILLDHNLWAAGLRADMPAATHARVLMFNNLFTATGNTTATIAGAGAQILSARNTYQGVHNPLARQSTGLLRALENMMTATTGSTAPGEDKVFVPAYSYVMTATTTTADITAHAGSTAGKDTTHPAAINATASITATVAGDGATSGRISATVPAGGGFTLAAHATGFTPAARQWYRDNFAITGATAATHTVTAAGAATHAGAYVVTLTTPAGELRPTPAFTVTIKAGTRGTRGTDGGGTGGNGNGNGGSGGGGAPTLFLLPTLALLFALARRNQK